MEDGLRDQARHYQRTKMAVVLILVLMEDGLRVFV